MQISCVEIYGLSTHGAETRMINGGAMTKLIAPSYLLHVTQLKMLAADAGGVKFIGAGLQISALTIRT
jgi:hypothetical protein